MSKRVSNKGTTMRKTPPRSRVKYGWRKQDLFNKFGKAKVLSGEYLQEVIL